MSVVRCFVGLPLPAPAVTALVRCGSIIRDQDPRWTRQKWVRPENLHVTVAFIGDTENGDVARIVSALAALAEDADQLSFRFEAIVAKPRASRATMIWAQATEFDRAFTALADSVGSLLERSGSHRDARPFLPHVTLVRARKPLRAPERLDEVFAATSLGQIVVSDPPLTLFSSRLTPQGPLYNTIASWQLGKR